MKLARIGLAQSMGPHLVNPHGAAPGQQPVSIDPKTSAHAREKLDTGCLTLHVSTDRLRVRAGQFPERSIGLSRRHGFESFVKCPRAHFAHYTKVFAARGGLVGHTLGPETQSGTVLWEPCGSFLQLDDDASERRHRNVCRKPAPTRPIVWIT